MSVKIYFGYAKSKRYNQAIEALANRADHKTFKNEKTKESWHVVTIQENEIEFLAFFFKLTLGLGWKNIPSKYTEVNYDLVKQPRISSAYFKDHDKIKKLLYKSEYLGFLGSHGNFRFSDKQLPEPDKDYEEIRKAITKSKFKIALKIYYEKLGDKPFGDLHAELLYLKRLSNMQLVGRDLLFFRRSSSIDKLIDENLPEFVNFIDLEIKSQIKLKWDNPLDILCRDTPTISELEKWIDIDSKTAVRMDEKGKTKPRGYQQTVSGMCREGEVKKGRLFELYPNPILCSRKYIFKNSKIEKPWITVSPDLYNKKIHSKGLRVVQVLNCYMFKKIGQEIDSIMSVNDLKKISFLWLNGFEYTGRSIVLGKIKLYEIIRGQDKYAKVVDHMLFDTNPFIDCCNQILRLAEDRFRVHHCLPQIGEGWVSESKLFNLIKAIFPDAIKHARPKWIGRQHLDIYIPSKSIAIEYHGKQHFEAVEFFGGDLQFVSTQERDKKKKILCQKNKVKLVVWHYRVEVGAITLKAFLEENKITIE